MFWCASEGAPKHGPFPESPQRRAFLPPLPPVSFAVIPQNASTRIASLLNNKTWERGQGVRAAPKHGPFPESPRRRAFLPPLPPVSFAVIPQNASTRIASLLNNKTWERGQGVRAAPKHGPFPESPRRRAFLPLLPPQNSRHSETGSPFPHVRWGKEGARGRMRANKMALKPIFIFQSRPGLVTSRK